MAIQTINLGTGTSGVDGDTNRTAFGKVNANFAELASTTQGNLESVEQQIADLDADTDTQLATKLQKDNNLSDLTNVAQAQTNLQVDPAGTARKLAIALG